MTGLAWPEDGSSRDELLRELELKNRVAEVFLHYSGEEVWKAFFDVVLEVTGSAQGFFAYLDEDGSLVRPFGAAEGEPLPAPAGIGRPRDEWGDTVWARAVLNKRTEIANNGAIVPEDHFAVRRSMAVPIVQGDEVIGFVVVANKQTDYDAEDAALLEGIAEYVAPIVQSRLEREREERRRLEVERSLRDGKAFVEGVLETSRMAVVWTDVDGRIESFNQAAASLGGYTRDEVIGRHWFDVMVSDELRHVWEEFVALTAEGGVKEDLISDQTYTLPLTRKDGEQRLVAWRANLVRRDRKIVGCLAFGMDMTEQLSMAQRLRESEQTWRTLINSIDTPVFLVDATNRMVATNEAGAVRLGFTVEQAVGMDASAYLDNEELRERHRRCRLVIETGRPIHFMDRHDDDTWWATSGYPVFGDDGEVRQIAVFQREVTEERKAQLELEGHRSHLEQLVEERTALLQQALNEAKTADEAKTRFLANMSHELRTPLNSILGFTGILLKGMSGELTDEQRKQLDMVNRSGRHLLTLIEEVLDVAKIDAGKVRVELSDVELFELVDEVTGLAEPLYSRNGLTVIVEDRGKPIHVRTDREKLCQVLLNLLVNAAKFTTEGGATVRVASDGDRAILSVSDTGVGVAKEELPSIMDEFHQVLMPDGMKPAGTGLGLAICKRLVNLLGGTITAASIVGTGSTFTVELPADGPLLQ